MFARDNRFQIFKNRGRLSMLVRFVPRKDIWNSHLVAGAFDVIRDVESVSFPGIILASNRRPWGEVVWVFVIFHWLVVSIFAALNIFLHIIYRKRPEVQPCEN